MFWTTMNQNSNLSSSSFDSILNDPKTSLFDVLEQSYLIDECRSGNPKLIEFLTSNQNIEDLLNLIVTEPPFVYKEKFRYKYAYIACEILSCNNYQIKKRIMYDENLLQILYSFIEKDQPLNSLLASFVVQVVANFFVKTSETDFISFIIDILRVVEFAQNKKTFAQLLLKHLDTASLRNSIVKLLLIELEDNARARLNELFEGERFVIDLIRLMSSEHSSSTHANVADLLCKIILKLRQEKFFEDRSGADIIYLDLIESNETVNLLLKTVLQPPIIESNLSNAFRILIALLECPSIANPHAERNAFLAVIDRIVLTIKQHMPALNAILKQPPERPSITNTTGILDPPLGKPRFYLLQLIRDMLKIRNIPLTLSLIDLKTFDTLLTLFFHYKWNNFLHKFVEDCFINIISLAVIVSTADLREFILRHVFIDCNLMSRLMNSWNENNNDIEKKSTLNFKRLGYIGNVINLCGYIENMYTYSPAIKDFFDVNISAEFKNDWDAFLNGPIKRALDNRRLLLGGVDPEHQPADNDYSEKHDFNLMKHRMAENEDPDDFSSDMCDPEEKSKNFEEFSVNNLQDIDFDDVFNEEEFLKKMTETPLFTSDSWLSENRSFEEEGWANFDDAEIIKSDDVSAKRDYFFASNEFSPIRKVSSIDNLSLAEYFQDGSLDENSSFETIHVKCDDNQVDSNSNNIKTVENDPNILDEQNIENNNIIDEIKTALYEIIDRVENK